MGRITKQNLIPDEISEKYSRKYLIGFLGFVGVCLVIAIAIPYIGMGITNGQITKIEMENAEYEYQKQEIAGIDYEISLYSKIISEYEVVNFPFSQFLFDMENLKPVSVHIISVDSPDRLVNEGAAEEKEEKKEKKSQKKEEENTETGKENLVEIEDISSPEIKYTEDLSQQKIVIRGYGNSQKDISDYLHALSQLSYVSKLNVVAIEEHRIEDGEYNIFEATIEGWRYNENQIP